MCDSVSIRNIPAPIDYSKLRLGKSEANDFGGVSPVLPLWPEDLADRSPNGRAKLIAAVERALREERRRGRAGARSYDVARHSALSQLLKRERAALAALKRRGL
jgi:hypothetical protein